MGKRKFILSALFLVGMHSVQASSENSKALVIAKENSCLGCHAINKKIVGPSYQEIATKYKNNSSANTFLKNKIQKGGAGTWGLVPMPANTRLTDAELSILVPWILQGAPSNN